LLSDVFPLPAGDVAVPVFRLRPPSGAWRRIPGPAGVDGSALGRAGAMTTHSQTPPPPRPRRTSARLIVALPIRLPLICVLARFEIIELSQSVRATLLFALLLALMATGMPISIALGLSVLTYLFILSSVDPKMVGLKLFTSIDRFEIMAIPFFILAGNFLT